MKVRVRPLLLAAALVAGAVVPLAAPAAADTGPVPLAMPTLGDIVVDEAHGHLFVSGGPAGDGIRVTDLSGNLVTTLAFRGAAGMALTPDGGSLWVAQPEAGLVQLDTATLRAKGRISLPTGQCPGDVAVVGERVVYGYSCGQYLPGGSGSGGIGVVDAVTGASYGTVTSGAWYRPVVEAGPDGRVYAADAGLSPTGLYLYDVTRSAPTLQDSRPQACSGQVLRQPGPGTWSWTASVAASGVHPSATATSTVMLTAAAPTTLSVDVAPTATAGTPLRVSGVLSGGGGPVVGATVTVPP